MKRTFTILKNFQLHMQSKMRRISI